MHAGLNGQKKRKGAQKGPLLFASFAFWGQLPAATAKPGGVLRREINLLPQENAGMRREINLQPQGKAGMRQENAGMPREINLLPQENAGMPQEKSGMRRENAGMRRENDLLPQKNAPPGALAAGKSLSGVTPAGRAAVMAPLCLETGNDMVRIGLDQISRKLTRNFLRTM
jgi:hypothetical protein